VAAGLADLAKTLDDRTPRRLRARWVVQATLELQTAAHLGGEPTDGTLDAPILRDRLEDLPLLTGTSLAGALRSHLTDVLGGYGCDGHPRVQALFGMERGQNEGDQSPLIVFDSLGSLPGGATEVRDGVAVDPATGTAQEHKKFDLELLPAGTIFPLRVELLVPERHDRRDEEALLGLLAATLGGLRPAGGVTLGKRGSRGLGEVACRGWCAGRFDLSDAAGWLAWLASDHDAPLPASTQEAEDPIAALRRAAGDLDIPNVGDERTRVVMEASLRLRGPLLIRSPGTDPAAPDVAHLTSAERPILPGTSLAGALRTRLLRIARLVREQQQDGDRWVGRLLGPRHQAGAIQRPGDLWASRLRIAERPIADGRRVRASRVRIDRFTQGVVAGALFDEEPQDGGATTIRLELRDPEQGEVGLLLLGLKDLLDGDLPLGGTTAAGRGVVEGTLTVTLQDGAALHLRPGGADDPRSLERANEWIDEFHKAAAVVRP